MDIIKQTSNTFEPKDPDPSPYTQKLRNNQLKKQETFANKLFTFYKQRPKPKHLPPQLFDHQLSIKRKKDTNFESKHVPKFSKKDLSNEQIREVTQI